MPLCVSCRGEYWVPPPGKNQETEEQPPETSVSSALDDLLSNNDEEQPTEEDQESGGQSPNDTTPPYICPRCGVDNQRWHRWETAGGGNRFSRFFFQSIPWGWLAIGSFGLPILAAWAVDFTPVASERIGIPLALLLIFVNVALLYALKNRLWRYEILSGVGRGFRPPLALLAVSAFVLALVFGLALAFMVEAHAANPEAGPTEGLVRVITTILLALTFVNVTLSAMSMAGHDYSRWLNREMPQPIYAQEGRLLRVIEDSIRARIRQATGNPEKPVEITITDMERTDDGGITLMIGADVEADTQGYRQLQNWKVTADRWGWVRKMSREGSLQYI